MRDGGRSRAGWSPREALESLRRRARSARRQRDDHARGRRAARSGAPRARHDGPRRGGRGRGDPDRAAARDEPRGPRQAPGPVPQRPTDRPAHAGIARQLCDGAGDRARRWHAAAGPTRRVRRLIDAVDAERLATRRGWGYPAPHYELATYYDEARAAEGLYGAGAKTKLVASGLWSEILTFEHRYVTEDVALGLALFESAARATGAATPAVTGLLLVFGALLGRELSGGGRALEHLGLGDFSRREIRVFLQDGWASPVWRKVIQ